MCKVRQGFAIVSLVCGLLGLLTFWLLGLGALFGIVAIVFYCLQHPRTTMSRSGFVCGIIAVSLGIPVIGCWTLVGIGSHATAQAALLEAELRAEQEMQDLELDDD